MKKVLVSIVLCLCASAYAQKDSLNLEDAILARLSKFAPDRISGLQWVKNSDDFCYYEDGGLVIENLDGTKETLKLSTLNNSLGKDSLNTFPRITWVSEQSFRFNHNSSIYNFNKSTGILNRVLNFDENAANSEFSDKANALAYTIKNNLFISDSKGKTHQITKNEDENIVNGQAVHRYEFGVYKGTFWSNTGSHLAFYRKDESMVSDYPIVNTDARVAETKIIKYPMAGMASHQVTLGIYNLKTEQTIFVKTEGDKEQYLTNIGWSPDDKHIYIAVLNRDQNHMTLNKYDAETGEFVKILFEEKHENYVQPLHPMLFVEGTNSEFLWRSERDGYDHIYRYSVNGKLLNQVTKGKWVVKDILGFNDKSVILTGTANNGLDTQVYKSLLKNSRSRMITDDTGVHRVKANSDASHFIDSFNSLENPGTIEIIDNSGTLEQTLLQSKNPYQRTIMGTTELYTIKAEEGTELNCRMIKPANFDATKSYPTLVYVYNGPGVQLINNTSLASASLWMHYLANEYGYIIFTVDGRGSENRGRDFEQAMFRNLGEVEMKDQITGVEHLKSLGFVDENRIAVHGWSYGGFMTTNLLCSYPNVFTCGVAGGPVIDWKFYEIMYTERFMDTPQTNPEGYKSASLLNKAKDLQDNLLMIHGTQDDVVVWQHSLAFVQECVSAGVQLDYFPYPGHAHNVRGKDRVHLMRKVIDYILENNK
tara:strand:+ start:1318 stop:3438 length:2121 start_codon:yes stop_codon:yes gene_type:complete